MKMIINFHALIVLALVSLLAQSVAGIGECNTTGPPCSEGLCCSNEGYCGDTEAYCLPENCKAQCWGSSVGDIITESVFNELIPNHKIVTCPGHDLYTYDGFITAANNFSTFGNTGDIENRTRELAAFFAQTSTKTHGGTSGAPDEYEWGYCYKEESSVQPECIDGYPCPPGISYHQRGPIGLEYNKNYYLAGEALGYDLINHPELVTTDPIVTFKTAIWFWLTAQSSFIPSCHDVMVGNWEPTDEDIDAGRLPGYGVTINILFPGECGIEEDYYATHSVNYYNRSTSILGVSPGENVNCTNQKPFPNPIGLKKHYPRNVLRMPLYKA